MTGVLSKDTILRSGLLPSRSDLIGILLKAVWPLGTSISKSKVDLRFGSSKQGKALRASQDSN